MAFQRARSEEQVQRRIDEIIDSAMIIYDQQGYEEVTFSKISEMTKFTRPTIYKYFSTKEEVLLKILTMDIGRWTTRLIGSFKINKLYTIRDICHIWGNSVIENRRLLGLFSILFTIIEKNVSKEALVDFKTSIFSYQSALADLMSQLMPNLTQEQISYFLNAQLTIALGLYPMCNLTPLQMEAIALSNINHATPAFVDEYKKNIYHILYCLDKNIEFTQEM
ncbi:MAG: TetR family transcriptional regulator [Thermotaleaceae bacterium]